MAEYPPYKHEGVYNNSIRLLHLDKNDAILDGKSTLQGSLRSVSLARPGSFDAISYACEGQKETEYILIDGQRLGITINCRDGLQYLRSTHGVRTIWVDAICIAPDKTDKSRQIPLMTDIYGKAQTVYIWLGTRHPDGLSERGLDWIQAVSLGQDTLLGIRQAQFPKNLLPREIAKAIIIISRVVKAKLARPPPNAIPRQDELDALRDIASRPYFSRVWCMQEAAMAERPTVVCGKVKIPWNSLVWGLITTHRQADAGIKNELWPTVQSVATAYSLWLEIVRESEFRISKHRMWVPKDWRIYNLWMFFLDQMEIYGLKIFNVQLMVICAWISTRLILGLRPFNSSALAVLVVLCVFTRLLTPPRTDNFWDHNFRISLIKLLSSVRKQRTTDPKDKVYALYGLLQRLGVRLPAPDYTPENSLEQAYTGFTHSIIEWHHSLEILMEASGSWGSNAPSWVTDWSVSRKHLKTLHPGDDASDLIIYPEHDVPYSFSKDLCELTVPAQRLGELTFRIADLIPVRNYEEPVEDSKYTPKTLKAYQENSIVLKQWLRAVQAFFPTDFTNVLSTFLSSIPIADLPESPDEREDIFHQWIHMILDDQLIVDHRGKDIHTNSPTGIAALENVDLLRHFHSSLSTILSSKQATFFIARTILSCDPSFECEREPESEPLHAPATFVLGWGAASSQVGDKLFFLQTLKVPVVLRCNPERDGSVDDEHGERFNFLGAVHVPALEWNKHWTTEKEKERRNVTLI